MQLRGASESDSANPKRFHSKQQESETRLIAYELNKEEICTHLLLLAMEVEPAGEGEGRADLDLDVEGDTMPASYDDGWLMAPSCIMPLSFFSVFFSMLINNKI